MRVKIEQRLGKVFIVHLDGDVHYGTSPKVREEIFSLIKQRTNHIIVDLTGVDYMDFSGIATLAEARLRSKWSNIRFTLTGIGPSLESVFDVANLKDIFEIVEWHALLQREETKAHVAARNS
jgi:anti-sigma B factor antagonist